MRIYAMLSVRAVGALDQQRRRHLDRLSRLTPCQHADLSVMAALDRDRLTGDLVGHRAYGVVR